jgi:hypothetical protein
VTILENLVEKKSLKLILLIYTLSLPLGAQEEHPAAEAQGSGTLSFGYDIENQTAGWSGSTAWQLSLPLTEESAAYWGLNIGQAIIQRPTLAAGWGIMRYQEDSPYQNERVPFLDWPRAQFNDYTGDFLIFVGYTWGSLEGRLSWGSPFSYQDPSLYPLGENEAWAQSSLVLFDLGWESVPGGRLDFLAALPLSYGDPSSPGFSLAYRHPLFVLDQESILKAYGGGSVRLPQPDSEVTYETGWEAVLGLLLEPEESKAVESILFQELPIDQGASLYLHVLSPRDSLFESALFNLASSLATSLPLGPGELTLGANLSGILSFVDSDGLWSPFIGLKEFIEYEIEGFRFGIGSQYQYGDDLGAVSGELFLRAGLGFELLPLTDFSLVWKSNNFYPTTGTPAGSIEISINSEFF